MKVGMFLGYGPQTVLNKEGLGRYIAYLIDGFLKMGNEVEIACPSWLKQSVEELLETLRVSSDAVKWSIGSTMPPVWRVYNRLFRKKPSPKTLQRLIAIFRIPVDWYYIRILKCQNMVEFVLLALLGIFVGTIGAVLAVVGAVVFALAGLLWKTAFRFLQTSELNKIKGFLKQASEVGQTGRANGASHEIIDAFNAMVSNTLTRLVEELNQQEQPDIWYIPSLFWPEAANLRGVKVFNVPDLVTRDYAASFCNMPNTVASTERCIQTLMRCDYCITYGETVRQSLCIEQFAKREDYIIAIPHANNDMRPYVQLNDDLLRRHGNTDKDFTRAYAELLTGFNRMQYIFYASQIRPHKNMLNLIQAYEYLLRRQKIHCRLVLTCSLQKMPEIERYVWEHNLQNEVLCMYNVSAKRLAALYYCASLVVNPTLYEGGFPFTFGEGMSVGTPSLMSRIPQVTEYFSPAGLDDCLFDPYDWMDLAKKIEYWLPRTEELYQKELPLYRKLAKRTTDVVACEYVKAFEYFIALEAKKMEEPKASAVCPLLQSSF